MWPSSLDDAGASHVHHGARRDVIDVEWSAPDGGIGGFVRADVRVDRAATAFVAAVVGREREPVVVLDHDLPVPGSVYELRSSGIWTHLTCEEPLVHWTIGLEAFGLQVDEADVVDPTTYGHRTPVGLDLDLETIGAPGDVDGGFRLDLHVHGVVLVGDEVIDVDGAGVRRRRWDGSSPVLGTPSDAAAVASVSLRWPEADGATVVSRRSLVVEGGDPRWSAQ